MARHSSRVDHAECGGHRRNLGLLHSCCRQFARHPGYTSCLSEVSDATACNHSTASSFQSTCPSQPSTPFASISRHPPFSLSMYPQAWVPVAAAFDLEPTRRLLQDI